jgi:meso-butanediol dehydrogenase / (S,S)-butanediol dehydrogenase / diacetyl reductase
MDQSEVAIVTGAGSGIGRATAELFVDRGYKVVGLDLTDDSLSWMRTHPHTDRLIALSGDVAEESTNRAAVETAVEAFGRLDVTVLNAGIANGLHWDDPAAMERFERIMAVNVTGVVHGINQAAKVMVPQKKGSILVTASTSGLRGDPGNFAYNASKAAVINIVRAAACDFGSHNVRVNAVAPGPVETGITAGLSAMPELKEAMARRIPLRRWGQPSELAEAFYFLASPAASFITGTTLMCDGGHSAHAAHFELDRKR